mgnify:CR=1 FL=1
MRATLKAIIEEYGLKSRLAAPLAGRFVRAKLKAEDARMRAGFAHEPPTFYEKNQAAHAAGIVELRAASTASARPRAEGPALPAAARGASCAEACASGCRSDNVTRGLCEPPMLLRTA